MIYAIVIYMGYESKIVQYSLGGNIILERRK